MVVVEVVVGVVVVVGAVVVDDGGRGVLVFSSFIPPYIRYNDF